jgi:hypothetical protein
MSELNKNVFPDTIKLEDLGIVKGTRKFRLLADFRCYYKGKLITVPKGFITDGISAPKFSWAIIGPYGPAFPAALVHDWLFSPFNTEYDWKTSNWMFLELMKEAGVGFTMRWTIYSAVVAGSYPIWKKRIKNYGH